MLVGLFCKCRYLGAQGSGSLYDARDRMRGTGCESAHIEYSLATH